MLQLLGLVLALWIPACSFVFVREPDDGAQTNGRLDCTQSNALPVADLVLGAVMAGLVAGVTYKVIDEANDDCPQCSTGVKPAILAAFLVVSPWSISSAVGFSSTGRCRAARVQGSDDR